MEKAKYTIQAPQLSTDNNIENNILDWSIPFYNKIFKRYELNVYKGEADFYSIAVAKVRGKSRKECIENAQKIAKALFE